MSKTKQRKQSAYDQGYRDGSKSTFQRWSKHPYLALYKMGHHDGFMGKERKVLS